MPKYILQELPEEMTNGKKMAQSEKPVENDTAMHIAS